MDHARSAVERLSTAVAALESYDEARDDDPTLDEAIEVARDRFRDAMDDDLNVSGGLGAVFELVRDLNSRVAERSLSTATHGTGRGRDPRLRPRPGGARRCHRRSGRRAGAARSSAPRRGRDAISRPRTGCVTSSRRLGVVVEDTPDGQRWRLGGGPRMADERGPRNEPTRRAARPARPDRRRGSRPTGSAAGDRTGKGGRRRERRQGGSSAGGRRRSGLPGQAERTAWRRTTGHEAAPTTGSRRSTERAVDHDRRPRPRRPAASDALARGDDDRPRRDYNDRRPRD